MSPNAVPLVDGSWSGWKSSPGSRILSFPFEAHQVAASDLGFLEVDGDLELSELTAISPLDGRYGSKVKPLRAIFSEFGLIRYRVLVEVWFQQSINYCGFRV